MGKSINKIIKNIKNSTDDNYSLKNAIVNYFLAVMFTGFPLFYTQQYANIRHDKFYFFITASTLLILAEIVIISISFFKTKDNKISRKKWYENLSVTDYAFGAFIFSCIFSTATSLYPLESFTGHRGRNNGLLLMLIYFGIYLIISRLFVHKKYLFSLLAVTSIIVYILCIINFFFVDPLGIFNGYDKKTIMDFSSTIGNRNLMACFCCLTLPLFFTLFIYKKSPIRYFYLLTSCFGFSALIYSNSESGFLGFFPTLAILFIICTKHFDKLFSFFAGLTTILLFGRLSGYLRMIFPRKKRLGTMQKFFVFKNRIYLIIAICLIISLILFLFFRKKKAPKFLFIGAIVLISIIIFLLIFAFINFTFIDKTTKLSAITRYLRFSEKWGTHRGFMWIKAFEIFRGNNLKEKLFGTGPDTFYIAFSPYFRELLIKYGNSSTNSAHNELINYLVTIGLVGVASYLTLLVSVIVKAFRSAKDNKLTIVLSMGIICYFFQSLVNIAQPITTPLLFILIAMTEGLCRKTAISKNE